MKLRLLFVLCLCLAAAGAASAQDEPLPLVVDSDLSNDDYMALLYLFNRADFKFEAITVSGTGFATCEAGVQAALGLLALADYGDVPVSCGQDRLWQGGEVRVPADWRVTLELVDELDLPTANVPADVDAVTLFTSTVEASEEPITVLALGPLTNIAAAFEASPELVDQIDRIFLMGGALDVPGSGVSAENTTAEWNIYADPSAARAVFESGVPITMIGLDATNEVPVDARTIRMIREAAETPAALFTANHLVEGFYFWDQLAAAVMTDPDLVTLQTRHVTIIDDGGMEDGRTLPDEDGTPVTVAVEPDADAFLELFIGTLNQE